MDWLKSALAKVYSKDGLVGVVVIVVLLAVLLYCFGPQVLAVFGSPMGTGG